MLSRVMEQLSHPFMLLVVGLMVLIAVAALIIYLVDDSRTPVQYPQGATRTDLVHFEREVLKTPSVELQELLEVMRSNIESPTMGRSDLIRTLMMIDFVEHTLHTRNT